MNIKEILQNLQENKISVEEAAQTSEFFGSYVEIVYDVGVAGIHRLLNNRNKLEKANCIIVIVGMEG